MGKLEKLTQEQETLMITVRDEWINRIFSCQNKIDKGKAIEGINWMYELSNKKQPETLFVISPLGMQVAINFLKKGDSVSASVRDSVRASVLDSVSASVRGSVSNSVRESVSNSVSASVRDSVRDSVSASVRGSVRESVRESVWASVSASVLDSVSASVRDSVSNSVSASVRDSVRASVSDSIWNSVGNSVWASVRESVEEYQQTSYYGNIGDYGWVAFYDFFTRIGILNDDKFNKFKAFIESNIFDTIQMENICIVCELPCKVVRDESKKLHNTEGFAIEWRDGYGQYYIHGRNISYELFNKCLSGELTQNDFLTESNEENKAAMYHILGEEKILALLEANEVDSGTFVHKNGDMEEVKLYKTDKKFKEIDNQPFAWVRFICPSTGTNYLIAVEPQHTDARQAAISTSPLFHTIDDYSFTDRT